jgi:hypothetical protein
MHTQDSLMGMILAHLTIVNLLELDIRKDGIIEQPKILLKLLQQKFKPSRLTSQRKASIQLP